MRRTRSLGMAVVVALVSSCNCDDGSKVDAGGQPEVMNRPPIAVAGAAQRVLPATAVTLDGRGSSDPDGDQLTFAWSLLSQPDGGGAALAGPTTSQPAFTPSRPGDYVAQLVVNDGQLSSAASSVVITALNRSPAANAGAAQTVFVGDLVTLDGTASQDPDGDPLTYQWSVDAGWMGG
jgi:PKD domain